MKLAVIPARGGSKRIPRKNVVEFHGKPLIAWTIEAALGCEFFDRVVVSTDDPQIAEIARAHGAEVPFLRTRFADDHTPVSSVTIDTLSELGREAGWHCDVVVQLLASCPLRTSLHITESYDQFVRSGAEFQLSACEFGWLNPWWAVRLDSANRPDPLFPEALKKRSQDLDPLFCPSGAIWIARCEALVREGTFYGEGYRFAPIDWRAAVDIDEAADLAFARALYSLTS